MIDISTPLPQAVAWAEGMLLSPQHLQQDDIYWHEQTRHRMACVQPHYWGLLDLAVSSTDLVAGTVTIDRVHCVMPDGLAVQYPRAKEEPLRLDLNACKWEEGKALRVNLAVPIRAAGAASRKSPIQRYDVESGAVEVDENTGEGHVEVWRLRPRLSLIPGNVVPPMYTSIPLLEVRRSPSGSFTLTPYHPPMLRASVSAFLEDKGVDEWLSLLIRKMREKAQELAGETRTNGAAGESGSDQARILDGLHHLATALPQLEILVRSRVSHPFDLYLGLAHLVGRVAAIGADPIPLNMEPYRHDDCMPGFRAALEYVETKLERLKLTYESLSFEQVGESSFARVVPSDLPTGTLVVELKPRPGQGVVEMTQWLQQARIGTQELMPVLKERRLLGAAFEPLKREAIPGLTMWPGRALYAIRNQTIEAEKQVIPVIQGGRRLMIQGPESSLVPVAIVMYRSKPNRAAGQAKAARQPTHA